MVSARNEWTSDAVKLKSEGPWRGSTREWVARMMCAQITCGQRCRRTQMGSTWVAWITCQMKNDGWWHITRFRKLLAWMLFERDILLYRLTGLTALFPRCRFCRPLIRSHHIISNSRHCSYSNSCHNNSSNSVDVAAWKAATTSAAALQQGSNNSSRNDNNSNNNSNSSNNSNNNNNNRNNNNSNNNNSSSNISNNCNNSNNTQ